MELGRSGKPPGATWPTVPFLIALIWGMLSTELLCTALDGPMEARQAAHFIIAIILLGRLVLARARRERNNIWMVYLGCMALAAPLYVILESLLWAVFEPLW